MMKFSVITAVILLSGFITAAMPASAAGPVTVPKTCVKSEIPPEFAAFREKFKKAVAENDRKAVLSMTEIPFTDDYNERYTHKSVLSAGNPETFLKNYDRLFTPAVTDAVKNDRYRPYTEQLADDGSDECIEILDDPENIFLVSEKKGPCEKGLLFEKSASGYKLTQQFYGCMGQDVPLTDKELNAFGKKSPVNAKAADIIPSLDGK